MLYFILISSCSLRSSKFSQLTFFFLPQVYLNKNIALLCARVLTSYGSARPVVRVVPWVIRHQTFWPQKSSTLPSAVRSTSRRSTLPR